MPPSFTPEVPATDEDQSSEAWTHDTEAWDSADTWDEDDNSEPATD